MDFDGKDEIIRNFNPRSPWGERRLRCKTHNANVDFNPRSPWGERPGAGVPIAAASGFQSTLPVGGATKRSTELYPTPGFQSTLPVGGATMYVEIFFDRSTDFNPRSPWGERLRFDLRSFFPRYFNPRSPWGERPRLSGLEACTSGISIHAPRGGSDTASPKPFSKGADFNPRSPWGERLADTSTISLFDGISIHAPRGGSDVCARREYKFILNFNPRSPWGERPACPEESSSSAHFNPRSPWGERRSGICQDTELLLFQSTLPVGGATGVFRRKDRTRQISIHAPRGGSDADGASGGDGGGISIHAPRGGSDPGLHQAVGAASDFNPRSPWGERPPRRPPVSKFGRFQSTLPVGGATIMFQKIKQMLLFQSTLPVGGATIMAKKMKTPTNISIHAPRGGSDPGCGQTGRRFRISIHAPRGGSDSKDAQISGSIFGKDIKFVRHNPGKVVPNRLKTGGIFTDSRKKPCEPPGILCTLVLRATKSEYPPGDRCSCSRNAQLSFRIDSPNSRNGGCPFPGP